MSADQGPGLTTVVDVRLCGQGAGPGDIAMIGGIYGVARFAKQPARAMVDTDGHGFSGRKRSRGRGEKMVAKRF